MCVEWHSNERMVKIRAVESFQNLRTLTVNFIAYKINSNLNNDKDFHIIKEVEKHMKIHKTTVFFLIYNYCTLIKKHIIKW